MKRVLFVAVLISVIVPPCSWTSRVMAQIQSSQRVDVGVQLYLDGSFEEAITTLEEACELEQSKNDLYRARLFLGLSYIARQDTASAKRNFRAAIMADPTKELSAEDYSPTVRRYYQECRDVPKMQPAKEADFVWGKEIGPDVTFYYQPTDSLKKIATLLKNRVVKVYHNIDTMLCFGKLEPIEYYCYDSPEAMKQYTGRDDAFFLGNRFYYGFGPIFGGEIAEYLIGKLPGGPSRFAFIRDGLPLLLDHSGRNYHDATNNLLQEKSLLGVKLLTDDKAFEKEQGMQKSVEAASLCAHIMYQYGYEKFMQLYHNQSDFPTALKQVLGIDTKELAMDWETFLPEHTNEKEKERGKSNKNDILIAQGDKAKAEAALTQYAGKNPVVVLETSEGKIELELFPKVAPKHVEHFLGLVRRGYYDSLVFHRVIDGFMIQTGDPNGDGYGGSGTTVPAEFNDSLHHAGTLGMARSSDPNSASSQFYICLAPAPHLDHQYTVFGKTIAGFDVVQKIGRTPTSGLAQRIVRDAQWKDELLQLQKDGKADVLIQNGFPAPDRPLKRVYLIRAYERSASDRLLAWEADSAATITPPDSVLLLMIGKGRCWMRIRKDADTSTYEGMIGVNDTLWFAMQDSIYLRLGHGNAVDIYLNALPLKIAAAGDTSVVSLWISRGNYLKYVDSSRLVP